MGGYIEYILSRSARVGIRSGNAQKTVTGLCKGVYIALKQRYSVGARLGLSVNIALQCGLYVSVSVCACLSLSVDVTLQCGVGICAGLLFTAEIGRQLAYQAGVGGYAVLSRREDIVLGVILLLNGVDIRLHGFDVAAHSLHLFKVLLYVYGNTAGGLAAVYPLATVHIP